MSITAEFMRGRRSATLEDDREEYVDAIFEADRFDGRTIRQKTFRHSTFANTSFKGVKFEDCTFENVVFLSAYFRDAQFKDCTLKACRFISCDLSRVAFRGCDVRYYNSFRDCYIPFDRLKESLPREGNLLRDLAKNLADQAALDGAVQDANRYREQSLAGEKNFLKAVVEHRLPHYQAKYSNVDRLTHAAQYIRIKVFELAWGRARRLEVIVRNWLIIAAVWAIVLAIWNPSNIAPPASRVQLAMIGFFSVSPIQLTIPFSTGHLGVETFLTVGRVLGLVFSAMFVALLFARIYEGRRT